MTWRPALARSRPDRYYEARESRLWPDARGGWRIRARSVTLWLARTPTAAVLKTATTVHRLATEKSRGVYMESKRIVSKSRDLIRDRNRVVVPSEGNWINDIYYHTHVSPPFPLQRPNIQLSCFISCFIRRKCGRNWNEWMDFWRSRGGRFWTYGFQKCASAFVHGAVMWSATMLVQHV